MNKNTCCFTGHRKISAKKVETIIKNLDFEIERLIEKGIIEFISGGAIGFDQIAASLIISKKKQGKNIRLIFALPCKNQDNNWNDKQKKLYKNILKEADDIIYVSENYDPDCMKRRNEYMVKQSSYCICALSNKLSGTGQTVRLASKKGLEIINVVK